MASIEQTRAVVEADETFDGRIIPTTKAELERPVRVREGATVQGSVYGDTIEIADAAAVSGSVMADESVTVTGGTVYGDVGTTGKIEGNGGEITGTVTGTRIRLTNCVVRGNVVGSQVILEGSVVLGIVSADRELTSSDTLCYTFDSSGETTLDGGAIVLPQAIVDDPVEIETPVAVAGLGKLGTDEEDLPTLDEADLYEREGEWFLTLVPRLLNLAEVTDRLDELERKVMEAVADVADDEGVAAVADVVDFLGVDDAISIPALDRLD